MKKLIFFTGVVLLFASGCEKREKKKMDPETLARKIELYQGIKIQRGKTIEAPYYMTEE